MQICWSLEILRCWTGLPDPNKPSLPLQPKTTATLGPFTATKFLVTATFTATFWAEIHLKAENIYLYWLILSLKVQSNEIFDPQFFFTIRTSLVHWGTDQWVKRVSILVLFSLRYSYFYEVPRSIILHRVKLCTVWYCTESMATF